MAQMLRRKKAFSVKHNDSKYFGFSSNLKSTDVKNVPIDIVTT